MLTYCNKDYLEIYASQEPGNQVETPLACLSEKRQEEIRQKPCVCYVGVWYKIKAADCERSPFYLSFEEGYRWDGATIPKGLYWLLGSPVKSAFLEASKLHDMLCEHHIIVNHNRYLSSLIFRETLIASGVGKIRAYLMFHAVDNYQKLVGKW